MLIGLDCDGVCAMFVEGMCDALQARGFDARPSDMGHWSLERSLGPGAYFVARDLISEPGFCANLAWYPGVVDVIQGLRDAGHDLVCVTSPWPNATWMHERKEWLRPYFDPSDIIFASGKRKAHVQLDYLVEDHPGNAAAWADLHPMGEGVLVDRPWNQQSAVEHVHHRNVYRVAASSLLMWFGV